MRDGVLGNVDPVGIDILLAKGLDEHSECATSVENRGRLKINNDSLSDPLEEAQPVLIPLVRDPEIVLVVVTTKLRPLDRGVVRGCGTVRSRDHAFSLRRRYGKPVMLPRSLRRATAGGSWWS